MSGPDVGSSINDVHPLPPKTQVAAVRTVCALSNDSSEAKDLLMMLDLDPALARRMKFRV